MAMQAAVYFPETSEFSIVPRKLIPTGAQVGDSVKIKYEKEYDARILGFDKSKSVLNLIIEKEAKKRAEGIEPGTKLSPKTPAARGPGRPPKVATDTPEPKTPKGRAKRVSSPAVGTPKTATAEASASRTGRAGRRQKEEDDEEEKKKDEEPPKKRGRKSAAVSATPKADALGALKRQLSKAETDVESAEKNLQKTTEKMNELKEKVEEATKEAEEEEKEIEKKKKEEEEKMAAKESEEEKAKQDALPSDVHEITIQKGQAVMDDINSETGNEGTSAETQQESNGVGKEEVKAKSPSVEELEMDLGDDIVEVPALQKEEAPAPARTPEVVID